jgi:Tfp pilus assembly protein PilN
MKIEKDYINLLPRKEKKPFPLVRTGSLAVLLFAVAWIALFGLQAKRTLDVKKELGSLTTQKQMLQQVLISNQKELGPAAVFGATEEQSALIRNLLVERVLWSEVFKQFSLIVPSGVWFDTLEGDSSGKTEIKITGGAVNYPTMGQFMNAMEKSGYFANPQLRSARKAVVKGREIVAFQITCETKRGESAK